MPSHGHDSDQSIYFTKSEIIAIIEFYKKIIDKDVSKRNSELTEQQSSELKAEYLLIQAKKSELSSTQRKRVVMLYEFALSKGLIK